MVNIDPGKALDVGKYNNLSKEKSCLSRIKNIFLYLRYALIGKTDSMKHFGLHSDLSIDKANATIWDKVSPGYANFTLFDDAKFSEKLQGMRDILVNWDNLLNVFDEYEKVFSSTENKDINVVKDIKEAKRKFISRKKHFEKVLKSRLVLTDNEVDALDTVEKLTSKTFHKISNGQAKKELEHLQIKPGHRKKWNLTKSNGDITIEYKSNFGVNTSDAKTISSAFINIMNKKYSTNIKIQKSLRKVKIIGTSADILKVFTEENVKEFKGLYNISQTWTV